ncbi:rCG50871 [Rattus norvegicus]|uniref:RCG50871 n=1 Tax=Rattus norvegicus TaxID=10116 RepID=A6KIY8_RAT|nr:rCG50871 [Rattus norvegicus]
MSGGQTFQENSRNEEPQPSFPVQASSSWQDTEVPPRPRPMLRGEGAMLQTSETEASSATDLSTAATCAPTSQAKPVEMTANELRCRENSCEGENVWRQRLLFKAGRVCRRTKKIRGAPTLVGTPFPRPHPQATPSHDTPTHRPHPKATPSRTTPSTGHTPQRIQSAVLS